MGNSISSSPEMPETIEQLAARLDLNALAKDYGKKTSEKEYVYIDGDIMETPPSSSASTNEGVGSYEETVSIKSAEQWERDLMADPKVRYMFWWTAGDSDCLITSAKSHRAVDFGSLDS